MKSASFAFRCSRILLATVLTTTSFPLLSQEISLEQPPGTPLETSRVLAWGRNNAGQTTIPTPLTAIKAIAAGATHTVALKTDGTIVTWGGQFFAGDIPMPQGLSGVQAIAAGNEHTVALKSDGTVVAWGANSFGQSTIPAGLSGVQAIAAGFDQTVALRSDGTIVAWGYNSAGQSTVPAGLSGVQATAQGVSHTVALKRDGTVIAWGGNVSGATTIPSQLSAVQAIAAGSYHTSALKRDGTLVGWGSFFAPAGLTSIKSIAEGPSHTVALRPDRTVIAWGSNSFGQTTVPAGLSGVQAVAAGGEHTVVLKTSTVTFADQARFTSSAPKVFTIKNNGTSALHLSGVSVLTDNSSDFTVNTTGMTTTLPAGDSQTTFSVTFTPTGLGWRQSRLHVVNDDPDEGTFEIVLAGYSPANADLAVYTGNSTAPADKRTDNQASSMIAVLGQSSTQGYTIKNTGPTDALTTLQWDLTGPNASEFALASVSSPDLGPNATSLISITFTPSALGARTAKMRIFSNDPNESPFTINLIGTGITPEISLEQSAGAPLENSRLVAWGANSYGQTTIPAGLSGVQAIAAGQYHTVALKSDGTVVAWGWNAATQTTIPVGLTGVKAIAGGESHTVALKSDGTVVTWGSNSSGQTTIPAGLSGVQAIAAGDFHTVALKSDGTVVAWGYNSHGQSTVPAGLSGVQAIAAGMFHTVALKGDGTVIGWGSNLQRQITIPGGLSGVRAIAAGDYHTVALKSDGTVVAWGSRFDGPVPIPLAFSSLQAIAAGYDDIVGLKHDGTVVATGSNAYGQTTVPEGLSGVRAIAAGALHSVALKASTAGFGNQVVTTTSAGTSFTVKNIGTAALQVTDVSILGVNAADFSVNTAGMLTSVPALTGQTSFTVTFHPSSLGPKSAWLSIRNDDLDETNFLIYLTGTGVSNSPPQAIPGIPDQMVRIGTPLTIDLSSYFTDPDGQTLTYAILTNSNPTAATSSITGSNLLLTGLIPSTTELTLIVTDSLGGSVTDTFLTTAVTEFPMLNPVRELSLAKPNRLADGSLLLEMSVVPGRHYQVEYSLNLNDWTIVPTPLQAGSTKLQWTDHAPPAGSVKRFYRAREIIAP